MKETTVPSPNTIDSPRHQSRSHKPTRLAPLPVPVKYGSLGQAREASGDKKRSFHVAVIPLVFEFYDHVCPDMRGKLQQIFNQMHQELAIDHLELLQCDLVSSLSHMQLLCKDLADRKVDLIVLAHLSYAPSGLIAPAVAEIDTPILLWPLQPMNQFEPDELDENYISLNHSVHGTMDLANVLRRSERPYGVLHGHWRETAFQHELFQWAQVGGMLQALRSTKPLTIGQRFPNMLDLRLDKEPFMQALGIAPYQVPLTELVQELHRVNASAMTELCESYLDRFEVAPSLTEPILLHSARNELALRSLLEKHQGGAIAVNFMDVCKEPEVAEPLHLAVSNLMSEGIGYGAEADWETASLVTAMQAVFGAKLVGFSEVFSVDYVKNRLLLRHWGEGNVAQAAKKPRLAKSTFNHIETKIEFPICDFQYRAGKYSLVNLSATSKGEGQIVHIPGQVDDTPLPNCDGVKSLFKPDTPDVREVLNRYAMLGGSHHLVLVEGDMTQFLEKLARLTGWRYHTIS